MPNDNRVQATTDTSTDRVMDRAFELEAHGDNGCAADARLLRALVAERDKLRRGWLMTIQVENSCVARGAPCNAKRCGCEAEMWMLANE